MQIFGIGPIMEAIQQAIEEGREPDPALVELLCQEGPKAIEEWTDAMANVEAEVDAIKERINQLTERKKAREQALERMDGALLDVLKRHFPKVDKHGVQDGFGVKTALVTTWVQRTPAYVVHADPKRHATFFKFPEPELQKKKAIDAYKSGEAPDGMTVTEGFTESVRVRRS